MSRDFTPRILHKMDKAYHLSENPITFYPENRPDKKELIYDPDGTDAKKWPNTYFLGSLIHDAFKNKPKQLDYFEQELTKIIRLEDAGKNIETDGTLNPDIVKWYNGKLDPNFYYREPNDEMMCDLLDNMTINTT